MRRQPQASPAGSTAPGGPRRAAGIPPEPGEATRHDIARPLPDPVAIRLCQVPETAPPYDDEAPRETGPVQADIPAAAIVTARARDSRPGLEAWDRAADILRSDRGGPGPTGKLETAGRGPAATAARTAGTTPAPRTGSTAGRGPAATAARTAGTTPAPQTGSTAGREPAATPARTASMGDTAGPAQACTAGSGGAARDRPTASPAPGPWPGRFAQVLAETLAGSRPPAQIAPWTTERARSHIRNLGPLLEAGQRPLVRRIITSLPSADVVEMSVVLGFGPRVRALAVRLERTPGRPAAAGQAARPSRWLCTAVEAA
jgi:hypothetical protein